MKTFFSKVFFFFMCCIFFSGGSIYAQDTYIPRSECTNINGFMETNYYDSLKYYADSIYPNGIIALNQTRTDELDGIRELETFLAPNEHHSFVFDRETNSYTNSDVVYSRFQQYYKNVEVEGNGYLIIGGGTPGGGNRNPCRAETIFSIIGSGIDMEVDPGVGTEQLKSILWNTLDTPAISYDQFTFDRKLVITHHMESSCAYMLAWRAEFTDVVDKTAWVNANTGAIIRMHDNKNPLAAPTENYGIVQLDDSMLDGATRLVTSDGCVMTYDVDRRATAGAIGLHQLGERYFIPSTTGSGWNATIAAPSVYQAHYTATEAVKYYKALGIKVGTIKVAANANSDNAYGSEKISEEGLIELGRLVSSSNGIFNTMAVFDIVAHEIGHTIVNEFFTGRNNPSGELHEALADMFSVYAEYKFQGNSVDWVIGDDHSGTTSKVDRDLANPIWDCATERGSGEDHERGAFIGHWFYLISEGSSSLNIPGIGVERAITIVLESLNLLGQGSDYKDFKNAVLFTAQREYGGCSQEAIAIGKAWHAVCAGPAYSCDFTIQGLDWICEESSDNLVFSISNPQPNVVYSWTFPNEWTIAGQRQGNKYRGTQLFVTDWPKYNYYPRTKRIYVYAPQIGLQSRTSHRIRLVDCEGDDPTCAEFYDLRTTSETPSHILDERYDEIELEQPLKNPDIKVYDIMGNLLFKGKEKDSFQDLFDFRNKVLFYIYYDDNGAIIDSQKKVFLR
ncbi:MAG: M4 family metallopeptidase [Bacteroidota bacterium]